MTGEKVELLFHEDICAWGWNHLALIDFPRPKVPEPGADHPGERSPVWGEPPGSRDKKRCVVTPFLE